MRDITLANALYFTNHLVKRQVAKFIFPISEIVKTINYRSTTRILKSAKQNRICASAFTLDLTLNLSRVVRKQDKQPIKFSADFFYNTNNFIWDLAFIVFKLNDFYNIFCNVINVLFDIVSIDKGIYAGCNDFSLLFNAAQMK